MTGKKVKHIGAGADTAAADDDGDTSREDGRKLATKTSMMIVITKHLQ